VIPADLLDRILTGGKIDIAVPRGQSCWSDFEPEGIIR